MIDAADLTAILVWHWVADFFLQSRQMGTQKSSSLKWLNIHLAVYTVVMMPVSWGVTGAIWYALINGAAHWVTDFCTSRMTSSFYQRGEMHWFWSIIGLDQLLHVAVLIWTLAWLT